MLSCEKTKVNHCAHDCISSVPKIWKAINPGTLIIAEIQNASCHPDPVFSPLISLPVAKMKKTHIIGLPINFIILFISVVSLTDGG